MSKVLTRFGDKMLASVLRQKDAHATCYWNAGGDCAASCHPTTTFCSNGFQYNRYEMYVYDCAGLCGSVTRYCYNKKIGTCA